ncbi:MULTISPECIES: hypothetical protein [Thermomonosporaceae]|uniref:hypothetical protein n=1 Tax=Thermomonosporaceae TaxID=2012 RepID=UPI00255B3FEE|nr:MULTISPECIES: hypothetical protein [Thermomonosporaceae]MDL4772157.1 hypothetical protein [Actinomadura xylanilytica]
MRPLRTRDSRDQRNLARPVRVGAVLATALTATALAAGAAEAAPCQGVGSPGGINCSGSKPGGTTGGGGGGGGARGPQTGGGGGGGPDETLPPLGLTPDQGMGTVAGPAPAQQPPPPPAVPTIVLAQQARDSAQLPVPTVHTAPKDKTYVRVQTSLWVDGFVPVQTDPITVGAQTLQATATPKSVVWQLGETQLTCGDAGSKDGGTCHYTYKRSSAGQPGGAYKITATVVWTVAWTCTGADCDSPGGDLDDLRMSSAPTALTVGEIQTNSRQ